MPYRPPPAVVLPETGIRSLPSCFASVSFHLMQAVILDQTHAIELSFDSI
jgi:hypothetical protein